jgi:hypothetical protein
MSINGRSANRGWHSPNQSPDARDVLGDMDDVTEDCIVKKFRLDLRLRNRVPDCMGHERHGRGRVKSTPTRFGNSGPSVRYDHGFLHIDLLNSM